MEAAFFILHPASRAIKTENHIVRKCDMEEKRWFHGLLKPLLNQRGVIGDDDDKSGGDKDDKDDEGVGDKGDEVQFLDEIHFEDDETGNEEEKAAKAKEGADKDKKPEPTESERLQTEIAQLREDKKNLNKALHDKRFEKKQQKEKDEAPVLTDEQLVAILEEHKDDPRVLLNAIKYQAEQIAKGVKKTVMDETEIKAKQKEIDQFLRSRYQDLYVDDSEMRTTVDKTKDVLGLGDNPFGDYLATGVQVLNNLEGIVKHWYEEGKKAADNEVIDRARKGQIKDGQLTPSGKQGNKDSDGGLTPSQLETAKRLGFKTSQQIKLYRDQILASKKSKEN